MPGAQQPSSAAPASLSEPLRVLMPSPIGPLGVELTWPNPPLPAACQPAVTRLLIDPAEPVKSAFTPLHQLAGSEFLDEVLGRLSEYFAGVRRKLDLRFDLQVAQ